MRKIIVLVAISVSVLILAVLADRFLISKVGDAPHGPSPPVAGWKESPVTLMPPYPEGKDGNSGRISLALAIRTVCFQAGIGYDAEASRAYAEPAPGYGVFSPDDIPSLGDILSLLDKAKVRDAQHQYYASAYKKYLFPEFENIPWEDAMERLLSPFNLTYVVEDDAVVLKRPESCCEGKETLVRLIPPYTLWKRFKDEPPERTTIQRAVQLICEQAEMELDWPKTYGNIGPLAVRYTYPDLEDITWEDAMREILSPGNLDYTIEDSLVTLVSTKYGQREPDSIALVTLKAPYAEWVRKPDGRRYRLALNDAVWALCLQAGMKNIHYKSGQNTKSLLNRLVYPDIDRITWEEAMEELLAPRYLTYVIHDGGVLLKRADNKGLGEDSLVTLTPPYSAWRPGKDHTTSAISLQHAVMAICEQAGFRYDWNKSEKNTYPLNQRDAHPDFENLNWEEAIAELLAPFALTYTIEHGQVVLDRSGSDVRGKDTLVTLKSPYIMLEYKNGEPQERISVTFAVRALSNQAGYKLNWNESKKNVGKLFSRWVYPEIENVTWEEAMDELLSPLGITYALDGMNVILVMADGSEPPSAPAHAVSARKQAPRPDTNRLVTLKPPYTETDGPSGKITLQYSVKLICRQAGMEYDWKRSAANTEPLCRQYVDPDFEGIPWEKAMDDILDPLGLAHTFENGKVVLIR